MYSTFLSKSILAYAAVSIAVSASAAPLLTSAYEAQLETWLGAGDQTWTHLFTKVAADGKTATDFHTAVDGKGATITLMQLKVNGSGTEALVGGYNPVSWRSDGTYTVTPNDEDRTAFLFNLSTGTIHRQNLASQGGPGAVWGEYQTHNGSTGPRFGFGHDLAITDNTLQSGHAYDMSYGQNDAYANVFQGDSLWVAFAVSGFEVYAVSPGHAGQTAVPDANETWLLVATAGLILACARSIRGAIKYAVRRLERSQRTMACVSIAAVAGMANPLRAVPLLTSAYEAQLETWLGAGDQTWTNIFTKVAGDGRGPSDFHAAADGKGATFSLLTTLIDGNTVLIGGYNPASWRNDNTYTLSQSAADRTAFIFNLSSGTIQRQNTEVGWYGDTGYWQTSNNASSGPVFGRNELRVDSFLEAGYVFNYSYGGTWETNILGTAAKEHSFAVHRLEVYTLATADPTGPSVPDGGTTVGLLGLAGLVLCAVQSRVTRSRRSVSGPLLTSACETQVETRLGGSTRTANAARA